MYLNERFFFKQMSLLKKNNQRKQPTKNINFNSTKNNIYNAFAILYILLSSNINKSIFNMKAYNAVNFVTEDNHKYIFIHKLYIKY